MRPLLICDCDEVLLHMVRHFGSWLAEDHAIDLDLANGNFAQSLRRRDGEPVAPGEIWTYLDGFFPAQMARQTLVPGALDALTALATDADIVILTNLANHCRPHRIEQLAAHGIAHRVECNQGGKGGPVAALVAEYRAPVTVFVDDLGVHHDSVARHAPEVHRLHMVAEPVLARAIPAAPAAHARIDDWQEARAWIADRFAHGQPASA
ncbi:MULTISPECIES: hypothetical protein [unclassified Sphingomonas]|uniref:hypothetical protein n=1 Tax=unclassified Sphingomonas TaxID=196159 RepID=UPI0008366CCB|nr:MULTISPECIES: hypothetical protein [unclassified Sphingomonas]